MSKAQEDGAGQESCMICRPTLCNRWILHSKWTIYFIIDRIE